MKMEEIDLIERIIRHGLASLSEALYYYWPSAGKRNELPERNISTYVASSFIEKEFIVFTEANFPRDALRRIDFVAIDLHKDIMVVGESKKLHYPSDAEKMLGDIKRISKFKLSDEHEKPPDIKSTFGLLLATTWDENIFKWWESEDHSGKPTKGEKSDSWKELGEELDRPNVRCGSYLLGYDDKDKKYHTHKGLYALFPVNH